MLTKLSKEGRSLMEWSSHRKCPNNKGDVDLSTGKKNDKTLTTTISGQMIKVITNVVYILALYFTVVIRMIVWTYICMHTPSK